MSLTCREGLRQDRISFTAASRCHRSPSACLTKPCWSTTCSGTNFFRHTGQGSWSAMEGGTIRQVRGPNIRSSGALGAGQLRKTFLLAIRKSVGTPFLTCQEACAGRGLCICGALSCVSVERRAKAGHTFPTHLAAAEHASTAVPAVAYPPSTRLTRHSVSGASMLGNWKTFSVCTCSAHPLGSWRGWG
eukprot:jgi/Botrbrau1/21613/Bobra.43_1s0017.1